MKYILTIVFTTTFNSSHGQTAVKLQYQIVLDSLKKEIYKENGSFKKVVFLTENVALGNSLSYDKFNSAIQRLAGNVNIIADYLHPVQYKYADSANLKKNYAIFKLLKDTTKIYITKDTIGLHIPYSYDYEDFSGKKNWFNMFVTKLLATQSGNCHSLPYLYKMLADETGAHCWISMAPGHLYIKNRCQKTGWYNTELTSGEFPTDAWIMASGYLPINAVKTGVYMDTLSNRQCIGLCILDLAKEYEFQTQNYYDGFIIECCDLVLQYHSLNVQAILLKAETLKRVYENIAAVNNHTVAIHENMQQLYVKLLDLGYREMPEKMYQQWLQSIIKEKNKYANKLLTPLNGENL